MKFRKAEKEDLVDIVKMLAQDKLGQTREISSDPVEQSYINAFEKITEDANQYLMVLELEEEVVGVFQLTFIPYLTYRGRSRAQVEGVRVRSDKRGLGLGEKMFLWAIEKARTEGAHLIQLTTDKKRPEAMRFYEKLGFIGSHEGMKLHFSKGK
ncbi:MAG: GNAT superfamily N-acetyltransferase [Maribacter sp.]|jgi:GNAT superfamily N-acetyltransferase